MEALLRYWACVITRTKGRRVATAAVMMLTPRVNSKLQWSKWKGKVWKKAKGNETETTTCTSCHQHPSCLRIHSSGKSRAENLCFMKATLISFAVTVATLLGQLKLSSGKNHLQHTIMQSFLQHPCQLWLLSVSICTPSSVNWNQPQPLSALWKRDSFYHPFATLRVWNDRVPVDC